MSRTRRQLPDRLPPTYCVAGEGVRASHEWAPHRDEDFYCSRCLARLEADIVEEWQALHERAARSLDEPAAHLDMVALAADALALTPLERRLLLRMASEADAVITYSELANCVWGRTVADGHDRAALRQHIAMLRRKLATLGASRTRIALRHWLPNSMGPVIVEATFLIPRAIFAEAALSFIGVGVSPPTPSLGLLINEHFDFVLINWTGLFFPTALLAILFIAFSFFGDGLRDALDPRSRRVS